MQSSDKRDFGGWLQFLFVRGTRIARRKTRRRELTALTMIDPLEPRLLLGDVIGTAALPARAALFLTSAKKPPGNFARSTDADS
jgi:hypothetical protein